MKILLVHLSDIHFHAQSNGLSSNVERLIGPIRSVLPGIQCCALVVTGDLAFSGKGEEYDVATTFLEELREGVAASREGMPVEVILVPGNHDCSFESGIGLRDATLAGLRSKPESLATTDVSFFNAMLLAQSSFFLHESMLRDGNELTGIHRLYWERKIQISSQTILFRCFNTAWMSEKNELQGQLYFPTQFLPHERVSADLIIGLMHHPYNWFVNNNARELRRSLEDTCDVILTGHEHVPDVYIKTFSLDHTNTYIEGGVLQSSQLDQSTFHTVLIDTEDQTFKGTTWSANRGDYVSNVNATEFVFRRNQRAREGFSVTQQFESELTDLGTIFTHRRKSDLLLRDIFVYPNFTNRSLDRAKDDDSGAMIRGNRIHAHIDQHNEILIFGSELSGKTTLAKILFEDLKNRGMVPVLMDGRKLDKAWEDSQFDYALEKCVERQYGSDAIERYKQLDLKFKVLLIDNIEYATRNRKGQHKLIQLARDRASRIIAFAGDNFRFDELVRQKDESDTFLPFRHWHIREFGHRLRGELIEKWVGLGREYDVSEEQLLNEANSAESIIDTLLIKGIFHPYPVFVLTILQTAEANTELKTASGTFSYFYQSLITARLSLQHSKLTMDTFYTFTSNVAYEMLQRQTKRLTRDQLDEVMQTYQQAFKIHFTSEDMLLVLENARILRRSDGLYSFPYPGPYYFFAARFLAENLHTSSIQTEIRTSIRNMIQNLHVEDNANILIFLVSMTKDEEVIGELLMHAKKQYSEHQPCDFGMHVKFANELVHDPLPLRLPDGTPKEHRQEHRESLDSIGEESESDEENAAEKKDIAEITRLNVALKALQIMGQILRNFPGALPGALKIEIAQESYRLGLRTLGTILDVIERHLDPIRQMFEPYLIDKGFTDERERRSRADRIIYFLSLGFAYGMITRISNAVGSEQLQPVFTEIKKADQSTAFELIDLSIQLDHYQGFPTDDIIKLYNSNNSQPFVANIIRRMVRDHLYLFPVGRRPREKVCRALQIHSNDPQMLLDDEKRF